MIHGDRSQSQRIGALNGFEEGKFQVLVATNVASRGIHVDNVAHVINYDLPQIPEDFIYRVGRTGRMGSAGCASTLVSGAEIGELRSMERALRLKIVCRQLDARKYRKGQSRTPFECARCPASPEKYSRKLYRAPQRV